MVARSSMVRVATVASSPWRASSSRCDQRGVLQVQLGRPPQGPVNLPADRREPGGVEQRDARHRRGRRGRSCAASCSGVGQQRRPDEDEERRRMRRQGGDRAGRHARRARRVRQDGGGRARSGPAATGRQPQTRPVTAWSGSAAKAGDGPHCPDRGECPATARSGQVGPPASARTRSARKRQEPCRSGAPPSAAARRLLIDGEQRLPAQQVLQQQLRRARQVSPQLPRRRLTFRRPLARSEISALRPSWARLSRSSPCHSTSADRR